MLLYHGSKSGIKGKIEPMSRELCDFGRGFYMGTSIEQPSTLICNYENSILYELELELDDEDLKISELPLNLDWALFVALNRGKIPEQYVESLKKRFEIYLNSDVIFGFIANDRMYVVLERFFDEILTEGF